MLLLIGVNFLDVAPRLEPLPALVYASYLVYSLCSLGFLLEGRPVGLWLEGLRTAATACGVLLTGRWFGATQLDPRIVIVVVALFGLSAIVVLGLAGYGRNIAPARPAMK